MKNRVTVLFILSLLAACGGSGSGSGAGLIDPQSQPDEVANAIAVKAGGFDAVLKGGSPPAPSDSTTAPSVTIATDLVSAVNGATVPISASFDTNSPLRSLFLKVVGSNSFSQVDFPAGTKVQVSAVELDIPSNFGDGRFCVTISGADSTDVLFNGATVCLDVLSTADDSSSATDVVSRLQGTWSRSCFEDDGEYITEELTFTNTTVFYNEQLWFESTNCEGSPDETYSDTSQFLLGAERLSSDGRTIRDFDVTVIESDFPEDEGLTLYTIIFVDSSNLIFGEFAESAAARSNVLDLGAAFQSGALTSPGGNDGPNTALADQVWRLNAAISGSANGQSFNQTIEENVDVSGNEVPFSEVDGESYSVPISQGFAEGFSQACDQGFDGTANVDFAEYSISGGGEIGTVVTSSVRIVVNGTCNTSQSDPFPIDYDVTATYRFERIS